MTGVNRAIIVGNLGNDPDVRRTQAGKPVVSFSVATNESYKDRTTGERKDRADWHKVVIFNEGLASIAEKYLHKGSTVYIEGKMQTRKWQDKDGIDRWTTEVVLGSFNAKLVMLDKAEGSGYRPPAGEEEYDRQPDANPSPSSLPEDDIPF